MNPPIIVIHGNSLDKIPDSYTRYLEGMFRKAFHLQGTPLRVQYKSNSNPFEVEATGTKVSLLRHKGFK
jgi:GTP-binding protein